MDRKDRLARNEAIFREVNERIAEIAPSEEDSLEILCECGNASCDQRLRVTKSEYEQVRQRPTDFMVAHGHLIKAIETIVRETDRFEVVRKRPEEAGIARATDPRS
jgi:hypothetical protein